MSAINNDPTPIVLPPAVVNEARNGKRLDTFAKVGLISLGVLTIAGTALAVAGAVKGVHLLLKDGKSNLGFALILTAAAAVPLLPFAAGVSIWGGTKIQIAKDKIREMVKRGELTEAQRFELYRRNQHHFTPREFYEEALRKVLLDDWNISRGEVDVRSGMTNLKSFEQSVKQFIADNATAADHANADLVVHDVLNSPMLKKQNMIQSATDLLEAFSKEAKSLTVPAPLQYLKYFEHLKNQKFSPKCMNELNAFAGEGKEIELIVDFMNCEDRDFSNVKELARVKQIEALHIKDLTVAYDLIRRCPNAEEAVAEVPASQSQDNLQAFCQMVAQLPHCPKRLVVAIPNGHENLSPRDIEFPSERSPAKVTHRSINNHDVYTYTFEEQQ